MKYLTTLAAAASVTLLFTATPAFAQQQQQQQKGGRGNFNPEDYRKARAERVKAALKVTDEEWTVLSPMIDKVEEKAGALLAFRMSSRSFGGGGTTGGGGAPGGPGGRGGGTQPSAEVQALKDVAERDGVSNEEFKVKIEAARNARKRIQGELDAARDELKKVVTVRQEAVLLAMGVLD